MAARRDPFKGRYDFDELLFDRAVKILARGASGRSRRSTAQQKMAEYAAGYIDRVADQIQDAPRENLRGRPAISSRAITRRRPPALSQKTSKRPKNLWYTFPRERKWPVGPSRHYAEKAIQYLKAGFGRVSVPARAAERYNEVKANIREHWSHDPEIMRLLRQVPSSKKMSRPRKRTRGRDNPRQSVVDRFVHEKGLTPQQTEDFVRYIRSHYTGALPTLRPSKVELYWLGWKGKGYFDTRGRFVRHRERDNPPRRMSKKQRQAWMRKYTDLTGDPQPKPQDYWAGATKGRARDSQGRFV